jgi:hypothetical protein
LWYADADGNAKKELGQPEYNRSERSYWAMMFTRKKVKADFPLDAVMSIIQACNFKPKRNGDSVILQSNTLETDIRVSGCNLETNDGLHLEQVVSICAEVPSFAEFTPSELSALNAFAGLSALVRVGSKTLFVSRLPVYRGETAIGGYVGLVALTAMMQSIWLKQLAAYLRLDAPRGCLQSELPGSSDSCYWGHADFQVIKGMLRQRGSYSNHANSGLTSEFPWEPDAVSAILDHRTSLFEMTPSENPLLGNGVLYKLELPAVFPDAEVDLIAAALNESEWLATDAAPFFGAWCSAKRGGRVAFVGFLPNASKEFDIHANVAMWSRARSATSRMLLEEIAGRA